MTVIGEPGIGKSRLVTELRVLSTTRPDLITWRHGRCLPYGEGITFWALGEIVKAEAGSSSRTSAGRGAEARWRCSRALRGRVGAAWFGSRFGTARRCGWRWCCGQPRGGFYGLAPLPRGNGGASVPASSSWRISTGLTARCSSSSSTSSTGACRCRFSCSARLARSVRAAARLGRGKRNATTISLSPLSQEEAGRLLQGLLDRTLLPAETQAPLLERAGGNPLYAEQFARMLVERGDVEGLAMPETVQALMAARIDTLRPDLKVLVHDAAVVGRIFWTGARRDDRRAQSR